MIVENLFATRNATAGQSGATRPLILTQHGESWGADRVVQLAEHAAAGLYDAGVRPGDRVALHMGNRPELAVSYLACFLLGAIAAPLNLRFKQAELQDMMERLAPSAYLGECERVAPLADYLTAASSPIACIVIGDQGFIQATPWEAFMQSEYPRLRESPGADVTAALLSSSGTTGKPKLIAHSHASLTAIATQMGTHLLGDAGKFALFAPMTHASGLFYFLAACWSGATVLMFDGAGPNEILDGMERHRCDSLTASPAVAMALIARQRERPREIGSLVRCMSGGDVCPAHIRAAFHDEFGTTLNTVWGSTEGAGSFGFSAVAPAAYAVLPGVETRLVDKLGHTASDGQSGELQIRGPNIAQGYWTHESGVAAFPAGWYGTGDLMHKDEDGCYRFISRVKDLIVRGSSNIAPVEIEHVILQHDDVADAGVVGVPDVALGQRVVALVKLKPGVGAERLPNVLSYVASQIADYKTPEQLIAVDEVPRNGLGKCDRGALLKMFEARCPA